MKKRTGFIVLGTLLILFGAGCGQKEMPQADKGGGQVLSPSPEPTAQAEANAPITPADPVAQTDAAKPLWAQDKMELHAGMEVAGVFDASREIIRLSLEQEDGMVKLFVDGEEKLSLPGTCEFRLRDILAEDACMELLVGEPASYQTYSGEEKQGFRVMVYRLHPGELTEVPLVPAGEDHSFYVEESDWEGNGIYNWYFGAGFFAYIYDSALETWDCNSYRMMPEGYLLAKRSSLAVIYVDGEPLELPEEEVEIDGRTGVGIAFEPTGAAAGTTYYNIYRTEDSGRTWALLTKDFHAASASMEYIYILDENTILCRFCPDGPWIGYSAYVTLDGGKSWEDVTAVEELEKYSFLTRAYPEE